MEVTKYLASVPSFCFPFSAVPQILQRRSMLSWALSMTRLSHGIVIRMKVKVTSFLGVSFSHTICTVCCVRHFPDDLLRDESWWGSDSSYRHWVGPRYAQICRICIRLSWWRMHASFFELLHPTEVRYCFGPGDEGHYQGENFQWSYLFVCLTLNVWPLLRRLRYQWIITSMRTIATLKGFFCFETESATVTST